MEEFLKLLTGNFIAVLKKFKVVEGRAGRGEFWYFALASFIIGIAFAILAIIPIIGFLIGIVSFLFGLVILIPSITVGVRRLHDINKTGWLMLLMIIPLVGWIIVIVFWALQGTAGSNKYGAKPAENKALKNWKEVKGLFNKGHQAKTTTKRKSAPKSASAAGKSAICGSCGAKNAKGTKFCGECGKKL